jgi:uncharacterized protein (DUF4213/DUF364 family)
MIIDDILTTLDYSVPVRDIRQGLFHTAVLSRRCGLAATLPRDTLQQAYAPVREPGRLLEKSTRELAEMVYSESIAEAAIGMALINSLLDVDNRGCQELNARELILERGRNRNVAIVGHFPFIPDVRRTAGKLWVIENNPTDDDLPGSEAENVIPTADVVAVTGTAFTNHTVERLLDLCDPDAYVIMLGDTVPLSPVLFDYGIDAVSGTQVTDPDLALRCVSQGATYRQIQGVRQLTMLRYTKNV